MLSQKERAEVEETVKTLIRKSIMSKLTDTDVQSRGTSKFDVTEGFLTDIMALGYNDYSEKLAASDILELLSAMPWVVPDEVGISNRIHDTLSKFKLEVDAFVVFAKQANLGVDGQTIIDEVESVLARA